VVLDVNLRDARILPTSSHNVLAMLLKWTIDNIPTTHMGLNQVKLL